MVDEQHLAAIFDAKIAPRIFGHATSSTTPVAQFVGGQPGAGKTRAAVTARGLTSESVAAIIGDRLRGDHPEYARLIETDLIGMPDVTAPALAFWVERAIAHARARRYSVLVEGTFRRPEVTIGTARDFREAGYRTHLVALAVPAWESRLGILDRFVSDHSTGEETARWTSASSHDAGYAGTPRTIREAIGAGVVDRLTIMDRGSAILFDQDSPIDVRSAIAALQAARGRHPGQTQLEQFSTRLHSNIAYLEATALIDQRTQPVLEALRQDERSLYEARPRTELAATLARLGTAAPAHRATSAPPATRASRPTDVGQPGLDQSR